ncbi:uncharacterized protein LY79DRAFT_542675 [Colletotrichum navitas]|uniref:Uncharacterized protein n=1 Tax=Colletotrichum navitas TaxID=681940 RepID=A0AAD8Q7S2_9PEZI|nr:uncharacterized protein LY79DRAFT_542675 [Colletotrichum navitas]KAK1596786.1 hypothetical protein LY79DRAFT_542675 [Colletotrichum navitas]
MLLRRCEESPGPPGADRVSVASRTDRRVSVVTQAGESGTYPNSVPRRFHRWALLQFQ